MTRVDAIPPHDDESHPTHCTCGNPWREVDSIWCCPRCLVEEQNRLSARVEDLERLLLRYRTGTPLGHQPHMIAHEVDAILNR